MVGHLFLGLFLGAAASKVFRHHRRGCGGRGFGMHHGHGHGGGHGWHGRGRQFFHLMRELDLSREQVVQLRQAWLDGKGAIASMRASGFESLHGLYQAVSVEPPDRARIDELARRHAEDGGRAGKTIADAVMRGLEILTPEQREKLRRQLGAMGAGTGGGGGEGPYRSATFV